MPQDKHQKKHGRLQAGSTESFDCPYPVGMAHIHTLGPFEHGLQVLCISVRAAPERTHHRDGPRRRVAALHVHRRGGHRGTSPTDSLRGRLLSCQRWLPLLHDCAVGEVQDVVDDVGCSGGPWWQRHSPCWWSTTWTGLRRDSEPQSNQLSTQIICH